MNNDTMPCHLDVVKFQMILQRTLHARLDDIHDICLLNAGMTNDSFLFTYHAQQYIMRVPGEGTHELINRQYEYDNYQAIKGKQLGEHVLYLDPQTGYKLATYLTNARNCNPHDWHDVTRCMAKLRYLHRLQLHVNHTFDLYQYIDKCEALWRQASQYDDYQQTKHHIYQLRTFIDKQPHAWVLTHIDANYDNFLFTPTGQLRLIDWEYAGMQDPHVDIAMFAIYANYNRQQIDRLIDSYFEQTCPLPTRIKIYCYVAICGLLWSNWSEYKRELGVDFGAYELQQYHYAQHYYQIAEHLIEEYYGKE